MRKELDRNWLIYAMKTAGTVVNKRSPKEILQKLLLTVGSETTVHGTDTEASVSVSCKSDYSVNARALLPSQVLPFISASDSETVTIEAEDNKTTVFCGRSKVSLNTEDPMEFPLSKVDPPEDVTKVDGKTLHKSIRQTVYATDVDSSRFALGGILLADSADGVLCVGADGRRLSKSVAEAVAVGGLSKHQIILPQKAANAICSMRLEEAWMWSDGSSIYLADDSIRFSCRMIEGRYPNWKQVIPVGNDIQVTVQREPMLRMLKQAAIVADQETRGMNFVFDDGTLSVSASAAEVGSSSVQMPIEYDMSRFEIKADYSFVAEFLEHADDEVTISLKTSTSPILLESGKYTGVVMPMAMES